jgi:uncharacterized protein (DUF305 family)
VRKQALIAVLLGGLVAAGPAITGSAASAQAAAASAANDTTDVHFMQGMIMHHAQALQMVGLIADHTTRPEMPLLGQRIAISQRDEIRMMRTWLQDHHEMAPDSAGHMAMPGMAMGDMLMPGMLTPAQMTALGAAKGPAFDRLFLQGMIQHHEGALTMVKQLFGTNGAAQTSEIFRFASDVDADQRAEIRRMRALLDALPAAGGKS